MWFANAFEGRLSTAPNFCIIRVKHCLWQMQTHVSLCPKTNTALQWQTSTSSMYLAANMLKAFQAMLILL